MLKQEQCLIPLSYKVLICLLRSTYNFDLQESEEVLNAWKNLIEEKGFVRCNRCACLTFHTESTAQHHSACLKVSTCI